jgi:divinyl protochlorophyllide a 8-vinyl-reductase
MSSAAQGPRIGPNAILQVMAALRARHGEDVTTAIMTRAGLHSALARPPAHMVAERDVIALHATVRRALGADAARGVMIAAGLGTGDYLLAHRIPPVAQRLLRLLPARLASRALLTAIARHTWTFAGSGECTFTNGHPVLLEIRNCPTCRGEHSAVPQCEYYANTFARLYGALVHRNARVRETTCIANGSDACRFEIRWDRAA